MNTILALYAAILVIILNVNRLYTLIKRPSLLEWIKKNNYILLREKLCYK